MTDSMTVAGIDREGDRRRAVAEPIAEVDAGLGLDAAEQAPTAVSWTPPTPSASSSGRPGGDAGSSVHRRPAQGACPVSPLAGPQGIERIGVGIGRRANGKRCSPVRFALHPIGRPRAPTRPTRNPTMTDRHHPPEHDAVLFALDCAYGLGCAALAADAIAGAADAMHRALVVRDTARVERWTLVVLADTLLWAEDAAGRARSLVEREAIAPEAARRFARRIAPMLAAADPLDGLLPRDAVGIVNAHGVPRAERTVLVTLGVLALEAAGALETRRRRGDAPVGTVVYVAPAHPRRAGPRAGLTAARLDPGERAETAARAAAAEHRARLVERHASVRDWLPRASDATVTVRARNPRHGVSLVFSPFVVTDGTPAGALGAERSEIDIARLVPYPPGPR